MLSKSDLKQLPAKQHTDHPRTSERYWFPQTFFDPLHLSEAEVQTVAANHTALNAIADELEAITAELKIPVTVRGGIVSAAKRSIGFAIDIDPKHRQDIDVHRQLIHRLKAVYSCATAGVDENMDVLWLMQIEPRDRYNFIDVG